MSMRTVKKALSEKEWDDYLNRCLGVLQKYGYTPNPAFTSRETLEVYLHLIMTGPVKATLPLRFPIPWYRARYSDIFKRWVDGMIVEVTDDSDKKIRLMASITYRDIPLEDVRLMTWECAMLLTSYNVEVGPYKESLNSLFGGIVDLLKAMGYEVPHHPAHVIPWNKQQEWVSFEKAFKKEKKET
jgi:hypothetical protein